MQVKICKNYQTLKCIYVKCSKLLLDFTEDEYLLTIIHFRLLLITVVGFVRACFSRLSELINHLYLSNFFVV